ncbi:hypothetical protein D3C85_1278190 [compost metagenome]
MVINNNKGTNHETTFHSADSGCTSERNCSGRELRNGFQSYDVARFRRNGRGGRCPPTGARSGALWQSGGSDPV